MIAEPNTEVHHVCFYDSFSLSGGPLDGMYADISIILYRQINIYLYYITICVPIKCNFTIQFKMRRKY